MATIGLKATFTAHDKVTGVVGRMQASVLGFTKSASAGLAKLDGFNARIASGLKTTALAVGAIGAGVGLIAKNVIGTGADFEEAITAVGAVGLQTRDQIADLEKKALDLGASTKFTATEAANAMEIMARAGFKNQEILSGVGGVLSAAAASGLGMAEVADVVSNALKGMGLGADQASRVSDVLALASARTNSTIGTLGESMKNLAPVARSLNIPFEQATAAVALLQDVGLDASEAGTATATMLTKLANPSSAMAAEMRKLGIAFQDAKGNALPLPGILKQFDKASKKTGGNMKVLAFFSELVGLRGQKAALNLKDLFASGKLSTLTDELMGAEGAAEKMATLRMDNLKGDWTLLESAVDGVKTSLFNLEGGPLRDIVKGMTTWIGANQELIKTKVHEFIAKAIPILQNFGDGLKSAFEDAAPMVKGLAKTLGKLFGSEGDNARMSAFLWGEAIGKWTIRWIAFSAALKVARVGMFLFENAVKIAKATTIAYNFVVSGTRAALVAYRVAAGVGAASTIAMSGAMTGATASAGTMTAATTAAGASFGRLALMAGAAAAAVAAVYAAYDQNEKLKKETGGKGIFDVATDLASGMSLKESADEYLDQQAKQRRREQDAKDSAAAAAARTPAQQATYQRGAAFLDSFGMPKPGEYGYLPTAATAPAPTPAAIPVGQQLPTTEEIKAMVAQELTVKLVAEPGTTAEVVKKPAGAKVALQPSGGFY